MLSVFSFKIVSLFIYTCSLNFFSLFNNTSFSSFVRIAILTYCFSFLIFPLSSFMKILSSSKVPATFFLSSSFIRLHRKYLPVTDILPNYQSDIIHCRNAFSLPLVYSIRSYYFPLKLKLSTFHWKQPDKILPHCH